MKEQKTEGQYYVYHLKPRPEAEGMLKKIELSLFKDWIEQRRKDTLPTDWRDRILT